MSLFSPQKQKSFQKGCYSITLYFDNKNDLKIQRTQWQRTKNKTWKDMQTIMNNLFNRSREQKLHNKLIFHSKEHNTKTKRYATDRWSTKLNRLPQVSPLSLVVSRNQTRTSPTKWWNNRGKERKQRLQKMKRKIITPDQAATRDECVRVT